MVRSKRGEVTERGKNLHKYEIHNFYPLLDIISTFKLGTQFCLDVLLLAQSYNFFFSVRVRRVP